VNIPAARICHHGASEHRAVGTSWSLVSVASVGHVQDAAPSDSDPSFQRLADGLLAIGMRSPIELITVILLSRMRSICMGLHLFKAL
jgi:hypothetical protein